MPGAARREGGRWLLPGDALVELEGRGALEQRISAAIVRSVGGFPQRRAAGGCYAGWRGPLTEVGAEAIARWD